MIKLTTVIKNKSGLHARPASKFTKLAASFKSDISVEYKNKIYNGKSIMSILSAGIDGNSELVLTVNGVDESVAMTELVDLIENGIGE